jgi:hypothetical protein
MLLRQTARSEVSSSAAPPVMEAYLSAPACPVPTTIKPTTPRRRSSRAKIYLSVRLQSKVMRISACRGYPLWRAQGLTGCRCCTETSHGRALWSASSKRSVDVESAGRPSGGGRWPPAGRLALRVEIARRLLAKCMSAILASPPSSHRLETSEKKGILPARLVSTCCRLSRPIQRTSWESRGERRWVTRQP